MKTPRKIWKSIAKKFKNSTAAKASLSSSSNKDILEEGKKLSEEILSVKTTTEQQTPPTAKTTTAEDENSELSLKTTTQDSTSVIGNIGAIDTPADACENSKEIPEVCKYSVINIEHKPVIDKATETNTKLCESEDLQPICKSSRETQKDTTDSTETAVQEPNTSNNLSFAEIKPCFDSGSSKENAAEEKPLTQQRQAILAGVVGAALLVGSVVSYIMKMHIIAVISGIAGLVCISFALYDALKPNTKFEKVESVEQPDVKSLFSLLTTDL